VTDDVIGRCAERRVSVVAAQSAAVRRVIVSTVASSSSSSSSGISGGVAAGEARHVTVDWLRQRRALEV